MKKILSLFLASVAFASLFYQAYLGLNLVLFGLISSVIIPFISDTPYHKKWMFYSLLNLICGFAVVFSNTVIGKVCWFVSFLMLLNVKNGIVSSFLIQMYHVLASIVLVFVPLFESVQQKMKIKHSGSKGVLIGVISLSILLLFFMLFKAANPLFDHFTDQLNFSWINPVFLLFIALGMYVFITGKYFYQDVQAIEWDAKLMLQNYTPDKGKQHVFLFIACVVFAGLNLMLLLLNGLDVYYLHIASSLPKSLNLSAFVHESVWAIVGSIVFAIALFSFVYIKKVSTKWFTIFVKLWILQSSLMVIHTIIRNTWYIAEFDLTYLRIAVYVFLVFCLIGLFHFYFLQQNYFSIWKFIHRVCGTWFAFLVIFSFFSWDRIITKYNLTHKSSSEVDIYYLIHLSYNNTDILVEYEQAHPELANSDRYFSPSDLIKEKARKLNYKMKFYSWKSYTIPSETVYGLPQLIDSNK